MPHGPYLRARSGKTIALGFLAHQFTQKEQDKYPVIFIHATQKVNEKSKREINHFCKMLEEKYQAKKILIIWDGTNQSYEEYKNFQNELINQGRSVLVVGSAYTSTALRNETRDYLLQIPIELDIQELAHFELYVKRFFPDGNISFNQLFSEFSAKKLNGKGNETNFLILLYRLLPRNRYKIKESLYQEIEVNEQNFEQELETNKVVAKIDDNTFAALFWKQGEEYLRRIGFHPENSYKEIELIEDEAINSKQRLTYYVAVACQFPNIRVPYSVIVRILGFENLSLDLFQRLAQEDFIRIDLDNEYLRTRTSFEAELFISNLLRKTQYQLISELISNIKNDRDEIDFAASLLYFINPQEKDDKKISFQDYWFQTYNMLKEMREIKGIFNARLLIQEVSHLREIIQKDRQEVHGIPLLLANAVENIDEMLREMKDRNEDKKNRSYLYLLTEKVNLLRWEIEYEDDIQTLVDYYEEAKQTVSTVRNINPTNFYALSSFYELVIKHFIKKMDNQDALYWEVIAYLSLMFESAEVEGVVDSFTETHKSQFYEMNAKVAQLTQQSSKMGKAITKLKEKYPEAYYYLQAKEKIASRLAQPDYDKKDIPYFEMAYQVLNQPENQQIVQKDSRCLYLKLRCWWAIKTRKKLFHDSTYQVLPFSSREWREGLILTESLLKIEDGAFSRSHIQYLHALCLFHQDMEMIAKKKAIQEYEELDVLFSVNSYYISRRQDILHIASENGYPKIFTGTVQNNVERGKDQHGEIYLTGIKTRIKFRLADFDHKTIFNRYDEMEFYIGFSFRKPIAVSKEQYEKRKDGTNGKA